MQLSAAEAAECTYHIANLVPKHKYKIKVQASNALGSSPFSKSKSATTAAVPPPPPALELVSASTHSLKLRWKFPKGTGQVTASIVQMRDCYHTWVFAPCFSGAALAHRATKLAPGRECVRSKLQSHCICGQFSHSRSVVWIVWLLAVQLWRAGFGFGSVLARRFDSVVARGFGSVVTRRFGPVVARSY
jgi:hypothetical protein